MESQVLQDTVKPFRVSIEGNIGAGKSEMIKHFSGFTDVNAHMEPVSEWCNVQGHNLLELLYKNLNRHNFMFQNYVQLTRLKTQMHQTNKRVHMFERSLQSNRFCFVEMAHNCGQLLGAEYVVLCKWYEWMQQNFDIQLDLIVYLRGSPELCYERVQRRKRPEESSVSLGYMQKLHESYEHWLLQTKPTAPVLVIDVNKEMDRVKQDYIRYQSYILGHTKLNSDTVKWGPFEESIIV
ncbi:deoxynucleoside kinase-like isoform X2 [Zootermopsis nevadensis]|nr:deoxynucleoside kinase-like isoform X2 [Zootermopsis nevadensis]XP_021931791.1 deoxynucleoside kinase-like isoform X2 [Zootermopsis nevadensis]XP_021931792.1 deoxynucleoside kinase-like isoform X2 [Zootermopsis nevadensis]XP_021931793.1 deoxynucleoside kinase-like isoform X2 [Zootermopsis nevadensis]XP_021931794.1 deoxynucleoside kinase-like isoform X2 [Zootermopsis nevadensis]